MFVFSVAICDQVKHYVDGLFFGAICTLLAVMMVYKYWDSITKEDLEFSVGSKQNVWEVKELINDDELSHQSSYHSQTALNQHPGATATNTTPPPPLPSNQMTPQPYGQQYQQVEHHPFWTIAIHQSNHQR